MNTSSLILVLYFAVPIGITVYCTFRIRKFETATYVASGLTFLFFLAINVRGRLLTIEWESLILIGFQSMASLLICGFTGLGIRMYLASKGPRYIFGHCMRCGNSLNGQTTGVCEKCGKAVGAKDHRCEKCDYDLMGIDSEICPECGERIGDDA